jgi:hypothetical protein
VFEKSNNVRVSMSLETMEYIREDDFVNQPRQKETEVIKKKIEGVQKKITDIMRIQKYQIDKEEDFSTNQIDNSSILVYLTIIQILVLLVLTIWQISSLRNLFKDQLSWI